MKLRYKLFLGNLVVILILVSIGLFFVYELLVIQNLIKKDVPATITSLSDESYLYNASGDIRYYDEVLTQSARNYALTQDKKWKDRYYSVVGNLDTIIKGALEKGSSIEKNFFEAVNSSNIALVALEEKSFSLVESGDSQEAIRVLDSKEYNDLKKIYRDAVSTYLNTRGEEYQRAVNDSVKIAQNASTDLTSLVSRVLIIFIFGIVAGVIVALIFIWYFSKSALKPLSALRSGIKDIVGGNLNKKVEVNTKDEFGELAEAFNVMTLRLKENTENIEKKIKDRTKDLEVLNKYMVGRELKMLELKKQINELEKNLKK